VTSRCRPAAMNPKVPCPAEVRLRYGLTPEDAGPGLVPGICASLAHDRENLGLGGRRVPVSRRCSGKTLTEHPAGRREVAAQVLAAAGIEAPDADRLAADRTLPDGSPRFLWTDSASDETTYVAAIAASLRQANPWRAQYETAKAVAAQRGSPPVDTNSATVDAKLWGGSGDGSATECG